MEMKRTLAEWLSTGGELKAMNSHPWSKHQGRGWQIYLVHPEVVLSVVFSDIYECEGECQVEINRLMEKYELMNAGREFEFSCAGVKS